MRVPARFTSFVLCVICATVASLLCLKFLYRESAVQVVASPETKGKDSIKASPLHDGQLTTTANTPTSAASNTPVETKSNTTTDFIHWLARIGFKNNGMRIVELGPHNRNVITTQSFKAGDIIMEMPIERTVNEENIQKDPLIHFISEKLPNSPWEALMGTFLLKHRNDPEYAPFIQFLPKFVGTPLFWSDSLLQLVQGTDLLRDVNIQRDHIKNTWNKFQPHLPEHLKITFEEFQWGWLVVQSRVWGLELESGVDQCVMSPMLDMVNHSPKPRGEVDYDRTRGSVVMTAAKDIKAGDYIDISYGDKSSHEFLKYYGFTIPDNDANEYCSLSIASNLTSESEEYQYRSAECDFYVQELAKSITDCNLGSNKSNQDGMNPSHDHRGEDPVIWAKIQNAAIEKRLKYPSTIEEDDVLLEAEISKNSSAGSFDVVNAIRVRRGEKICLRAVENHIAGLFKKIEGGNEKTAVENKPLSIHAEKAQSLSNKTEAFVSWLEMNGVVNHGIEVVELQPNNRNVRATRNFKKGDVLISMPENLTISEHMVQEHSSLSKLNESLPLANLSWETRLAVFLIVNRNNSQYTPLWEFLPTKIATPLSWPVDKLNLLLNGTHLLSEITKQREAISASFKIVEPHLPPTTTLADFTWAWQMFGSRVWDIELGDGKQGTAMVPVLDLVNHAANPKAEVDYSKETRRVEMVAAQDINAGEWLDISYGEKSSADLLKYYGFTVPENDSNESCVVEMMTGGEVCDFQVGMVEYSVKQCVGSNGKVDLTRLKELLDAIKRRLGEYPTTIDEDFELLRYIDFIDFDLANALRVRRAEKLCLSTVFEHGTTLL